LKKIGLITALVPEARCLTNKVIQLHNPIAINRHFLLMVSGMGQTQASDAATRLLNEDIAGLISIGTAGGLQSGLLPGDLCIPNIIMNFNNELAVTSDWYNLVMHNLKQFPAQIHGGQLFQSDNVLSTTDEKNEVRQKTNAIAVDMESLAVAEIASSRQIPVLALRVIIDTAETIIPDIVTHSTDSYGHTKINRLIAGLISHPNQIPALYRLGKSFRKASKSLRWLGHNIELTYPDNEH